MIVGNIDYNVKSRVFNYCEHRDLIMSPSKSKSCMDICIKTVLKKEKLVIKYWLYDIGNEEYRYFMDVYFRKIKFYIVLQDDETQFSNISQAIEKYEKDGHKIKIYQIQMGMDWI